jgi:glucose dehydrogenase
VTWKRRRNARTVVRAIAIVLTAMTAALFAQSGAPNGEWRYYGGDAGSTRYAPLDQINKQNVKDLRIAWRWKAENFGNGPECHAADDRRSAVHDRRDPP